MTKPEVIGSSKSTYTRVVRMVCEENGIEYTLTETAIFAPELLAFHPLGKMPALRHGDVCLFESKAIATYLDRVFEGPEIFPSAPLPANCDPDTADRIRVMRIRWSQKPGRG